MSEISDRLRIESHNGRQMILVDYRGLREKSMIELVNNHLSLTLERKLPFIADFHNTFATPEYVSQAKKFIEGTLNIIDKGALLGVDEIKAWILKGLIATYHMNYKAFNSIEEAITFLTVDSLGKKVETDDRLNIL